MAAAVDDCRRRPLEAGRALDGAVVVVEVCLFAVALEAVVGFRVEGGLIIFFRQILLIILISNY